jgi:hypothetical protein
MAGNYIRIRLIGRNKMKRIIAQKTGPGYQPIARSGKILPKIT